jgi:hypothetical protein
MPLSTAPSEQIDRYTGPYERWVFTEELGRPYAFPAIARGPSHYHTALLEGTETPPSGSGMTSRLPPLWAYPSGNPRCVTPFAFHVDTPSLNDTDIDVANALSGSPAGITPRYRVNFPIAEETWVDTYNPCCDMDHWVVPDTRPKAIVAVIDDGIPFAHRAFLDATGRTRISHCWLQSGRALPMASVPFGRELMNGEINALRARCGDDEGLMYRDQMAVDARLEELGTNMRRHGTHGSHVLGVAAGNDAMFKTCPVGDDVQIIAVQLPNTIAWDTSGFGKEMYMLSAIHYIFDRAREISAKYSDDPANPDELPLIVNFSYGWSASRHDGKSEMEKAMEELLSERKALQPKTAIVLPSGNNFSNKMHAQVTAKDMEDGEFSFKWKLLPDDRTSSYIEIWFPEGMYVNGYNLKVTPPDGVGSEGCSIDLSANTSLPDGDPRRFEELKIDGKIIGQLSVEKHRGQRWRAMVALIPTVNTRDQDRRAPSGSWTISIHQNDGKAMTKGERINIWVQRDDDPALLNTGGQQSQIVDKNPPKYPPRHKHPLQQYEPHLDFVRGYGLLNGIASSPSITRVAGYVQNTLRPSDYSGGGGLYALANDKAAPWGAQPTISAVADQSASRNGTPSIGVYSGSNTRLIGTSGAAPSVARLMVINAAQGLDLMHGMQPAPPPHRTEHTDKAIVQSMHKARMGDLIAPPVSL